ncbi:DUF4339 domain-containing protein [Yersinia sp. 2542 StPb PI]|uniref:DUF4339 domain-containing protein n=1 Tax=Yersinia sp. 2542 StPb PI TaxID=3117408 RepID=UPI003B27D030
MKEWFYEKNGQRHGPIMETDMAVLITHGTLVATTLVWQQGWDEWIPLSTTVLSASLSQRRAPPALPSHNVSNTVIWILAFAPLIGFMLEAFIAGATTGDEDAAMETLFSGQFWYITLLLNIALSYWDERNLKKAGIDTSGYGKLAWFVPVYLWKRAQALTQKPVYFWVWVVTYILTLLTLIGS